MARESFVTLATNDEYCVGALVLCSSLRQVETQKELTIMITPGISPSIRSLLNTAFDNVCEVAPLTATSVLSPNILNRKELSITFTKIHSWSLVQFTKVVFLDADVMVLHNIDELFDRPELSAAPDPLWPDCFNAGVFVLIPNMETYQGLLSMLSETASFDGREQGLLNTYFSNWLKGGLSHRLSCVFNCFCRITPDLQCDFYTSTPAWVQFGGTVRVAHFVGAVKPWHVTSAAKNCSQTACTALLGSKRDRRTTSRVAGLLAYWWSLFLVLVRPHFSENMLLGHISLEGLSRPQYNSGESNNTLVVEGKSQPKGVPYFSPFSRGLGSSDLLTSKRSLSPPSPVIYHPEFHDLSWDYLHLNQRLYLDNRFINPIVYEIHKTTDDIEQSQPQTLSSSGHVFHSTSVQQHCKPGFKKKPLIQLVVKPDLGNSSAPSNLCDGNLVDQTTVVKASVANQKLHSINKENANIVLNEKFRSLDLAIQLEEPSLNCRQGMGIPRGLHASNNSMKIKNMMDFSLKNNALQRDQFKSEIILPPSRQDVRHSTLCSLHRPIPPDLASRDGAVGNKTVSSASSLSSLQIKTDSSDLCIKRKPRLKRHFKQFRESSKRLPLDLQVQTSNKEKIDSFRKEPSRLGEYKNPTAKAGISGDLAKLDIGKQLCSHDGQTEHTDIERMYAWERGEIDYMGADRFSNILNKLRSTLRSRSNPNNL